MKHIPVQFHFILEILFKGKIIVRKVSTVDNPTNMLTKSARACQVCTLFEHRSFTMCLTMFVSMNLTKVKIVDTQINYVMYDVLHAQGYSH